MTPDERQKFSAECNRRREAGLILKGKTYPLKEAIKEAGGVWDGTQKAWLVPDLTTLNHFELVLGLPPTENIVEPMTGLTIEPPLEAQEEVQAPAFSFDPTTPAPVPAQAQAQALEEAEMVIEARETELADLRFRLEALATALSSTTPDTAFAVGRKVAAALVKLSYITPENNQ